MQREIDEAKSQAPDANWILGDARDLNFPDRSFDNATVFFSGMYMTFQTKKEVFHEIFRLLSNREELWIWDAIIDYEVGSFIIPLKIILPNKRIIDTGYGKKRVSRSTS